jgi:membrane-bound serine protease (ClpP class)
MKRLRWIPIFLGLLVLFLQPFPAHATGTAVLTLTIDGAITRATQQYLERGLEIAANRDAEVVILQLNTPGGDIISMKAMTEAIRNSPPPPGP